MSDSSIRCSGTSKTQCELVSPICTYEDIEQIQEIVRQLRHKGMLVNESTGIHIHIDASTHTAQKKNVVNLELEYREVSHKAIS